MVNIKAKIGLRFSIIVLNLNVHCLKSYCLSYNISSKMQIQGSNIKDFSHFKELKIKNQKSIPLYNNMAKLTKKKKQKKQEEEFLGA